MSWLHYKRNRNEIAVEKKLNKKIINLKHTSKITDLLTGKFIVCDSDITIGPTTF